MPLGTAALGRYHLSMLDNKMRIFYNSTLVIFWNQPFQSRPITAVKLQGMRK